MSLAPIHQLVLNSSTDDVGSNPSNVTSQGVSYINYEGKDCVYINSDSVNPAISIPFVVSNTDSFTISFWMYAPFTPSWNFPIGLDDGSTSIITVNTCDEAYFTPLIGVQGNYIYASIYRTGWDHFVITYENNNYIIYFNNVEVSNQSYTSTFTSTRINIGGNNAFASWNFGEQTSCIAYIRQICIFDSALNATQVAELYTQTQGNTILGPPPNPLTPTMLAMSLITNNSFTVSWSGGTGATSYTYTLNGSPTTPSSQTSSSATFTGLSALTAYSVVVTAVNYSESQASAPKNVTTLPNSPTKPVVYIDVDSMTYNSFMASWTGGSGATSYTYTLNGTPTEASAMPTDTSVQFSGLTPSTSYTLVITAINSGGETASDPVITETLEAPPFPLAIHQLISNNTDVGSQATTVTVEDPNNAISYTTNAGKDCIYINSDGTDPRINIPVVFTNNTPFTLSFWVKFDDVQAWNMPITINGSDINIGPGFSPDYIHNVIGTGYGIPMSTQGATPNNWSHIVITYENENGSVKTYFNGNLGIDMSAPSNFTTSQITIGGNGQYQGYSLGGMPSWTAYVRQICVFESALTPEDISTLYILTDGNATLGIPPNPLRPSSLLISALTQTSFTVFWARAEGATSYSYTLNGSPATPSSEGNKSATFTGLTDNTDYTVVVTAINATASESQASQPKNLKTLPNQPTQPIVSTSSIAYNSFVVSWTSAEGATSYTYTLNGSSATPSTETANSATFTGLTATTSYTLVVTAINIGGQTASAPATITTLDPPPFPQPINQLILNNSSGDVGSYNVSATEQGVTYTTYEGKDCVTFTHAVPGEEFLKFPCVLTEESSFTISFWAFNNGSNEIYYCPIILDNGTDAIIMFRIWNNTTMIIVGSRTNGTSMFGTGPFYDKQPGNIIQGNWNNYTITYASGIYTLYTNGVYMSELTQNTPFTSTEITIGDNEQYTWWAFGNYTTDMYIRQVCVFDSALSAEEVSILSILTQGNTAVGTPQNPLKPNKLVISSITTTSFVVSWQGGVGAAAYSYTINGITAPPSIDNGLTSKSATFTGLTPATSYTIVVSGVSASSDIHSSTGKNLKTFIAPINQLVLSESSEDFVTGTMTVETGDVIEYTTYFGKDCVYIASDGITPRINVPCVFTQASSFTFGFWINFDNVSGWVVPLSLNGANINIMIGFEVSSIHLSVGNGVSTYYNQAQFMVGSDFRRWNYMTVTYANGVLEVYKNGVLGGSVPFSQAFTTSQITIGGNWKYQNIGLGGQQVWSGYLHQLCVFDSVLSLQEIKQLYTNTEDNSLLVLPTNQLKPYSINVINIDFTGFSVSWSGGVGATSYTYTLNGISYSSTPSPSIQGNSATFTGLTANTPYTLVITAVNSSESQASFSKTVRTRTPLTNPIHQFVFNAAGGDVGTASSAIIVSDPTSIIEYTTYSEKDCMYINSDGNRPNIKIPYVVTNTSSFTLSYWANMPYDTSVGGWKIPLGLNDANNSIISAGISFTSLVLTTSSLVTSGATAISEGWNHIVITYSNKKVRVYINGLIKFTLPLSNTFTSTEINIGGNREYCLSTIGESNANGYIRQMCIFDSVLNSDQVSQLYVNTQDNSIFVQPTFSIYSIIIKNVDYTSFAVSWSGTDATSYTYMLNASPVTPSTDNGLTNKSAIFTGLAPDTTYTLVITAGQFSSPPVSISTKKYLSAPVNQFILNNSIQDVGTEPVDASIITPSAVTYGNVNSKDCLIMNTDGSTPAITIPYVITDTNPFTLSFWVNAPYNPNWSPYMGIDNGIASIIEYGIIYGYQQNIWIGTALGTSGLNSSGISEWNHIVLTYKNGYYTMYLNNKKASITRYTNIFTSTKINLGRNILVNEWLFGGQAIPINANIRQLCTFDYVLNSDEVDELYTKTQYTTALVAPSVPLFPYRLTISNVDFTTFTVSWLGGVDATFYTYTLNGSTVAPSISTANSATFTGLIPATSYTVVVTAVSSSDSQASRPKIVITKTPLNLPINEFIFGDSEDVGIQPVVPTVTDPNSIISYTTNDGKDCVYIDSDGYTPTINMPCVFTETSSFTYGFWIKFVNVVPYCVPITMNGLNVDITIGFNTGELIFSVGNGINQSYGTRYSAGAVFTEWNHITISYTNGSFAIYRNGLFCNNVNIPQEFTTSQITIGGNTKYQYALGGQVAWSGYLHQLCVFDSALDIGQVNELYTRTQHNTTIAIPSNPLTPYRLQISSLTATSFTLSWLGATDATSYTYTLNGAPITPSTDMINKSAVITGLTPGTSYTLVLTAVNASGETSSYPITSRTLSNSPTVLSVTTNTITANSFVAAWTGGEGATSYIYTLNGSPATPAVNLTAKTATFTGLAGSMDYTLVITAVNSVGQTSSEAVTVSTGSQAPLAITVSTDSITFSSFIVSWTGGQGATSYTYTLNGSAITPSTQTDNSATFSELSGATSYTLIVTAVNSSGQTSSTPASITTLSTPPTAPIVSSSDITYNSFVASWTGTGATSYIYTLNGSDVTPSAETSSSATFTSLSGSTDYTLVVIAVNEGGQTSSEALLVTTLSNPPTAPTVSTSSITYQSFVASWTGAIGATSYSYKLNGIAVTPSSQTSNSATFTSLSGSSAYILVVSAINNGGQTDSDFISITTLSTPPTAPIVTSDSITYQSFVASWTGGERATSYSYTLDGAAANPLTQTSNSATFASLNGATEYTLVVTAVNNGGQTASEPLVVRTFSIPPTAPIIVTSSITYQSFVASWTGALGASSYIFTLNGSAVVPPIQTTNSATFTSLNGATDYTLVITAVNNGGQAASDTILITTLPNPPTAPVIAIGSVTYQSFAASWTGGEGATAYKYKLNGSIVVPSTQTSNSATFASLNAATSYTLIIEAINAGGKTVSDPVILTTIVAPPAALSLSTNTITYQSFVASWTGGEGASSYTYMLNGATVVPSTDNSLTSKTVVFSSLSPATNYTLVVTAVNDGGQVNYSATATTLSAPPLEITVSVNTITYQSFVASWVGGEGATSYAYKLNGSTVTPSSQTTSSATFASLSPATSYTLIVLGITNGGETSSAPVELTTFSTPPTAPIVATSDITYQSFVASWTGADRATSYSYTLNGSIVVPSTDNGLTSKSATFSALTAATSYTLVVTAVNNGGQTPSAAVSVSTFSTPPTIPNVSTSAITYKSFVASWTGGSGATSYTYTLNGLSVVPSTNNGVIGKTATFASLNGSTDYTLIVTAVNNGGQTSSSSISITTLAEPAMALSVSTSDITYQSFVASWTGGSGATSYTYTLNGTPTTPSIDNGVTSKSATFASLNAATIYTLIVTAVNSGGQTSSTPVEVLTFSTPPTALTVATGSITYESFVASWTGGVGATSYIYRLNGLTVVPSTDNGLTSKSATFTSLNNATSYSLMITAVNNGGQAVSTPLAITTFSTPPTTPILATGSITYQSFVVSWTGGVRATSYSYTLNGSPVTPSADNGLTTQVALFSGLTAATSYTLIVKAVNNGGQSASVPLAISTFNTPPTSPILATSSITSKSFVASWADSGATSYTYTLNGSAAIPSSQTTNSATFSSLTAATAYTLIVTAVNNGGQNSSAPTTITTLNQAPTELSVSTSSITYQSFVASWTGGSPVSSYTYTLNGQSVTPSIDNGLTSKSASFAALTAATGYTLVVTAVNNGGSTASVPVLVTTFSTPPTAPIVSTGSITYQSFVASWTGGSGATSYTYTLNGTAATPLTQSSNSATFASLTASTSYTLVVTAVNNGGSTLSSPVVVRILNAPPLALSVTAASISYSSFVASWTGGSGATSYAYKLNGLSATPSTDNGLSSKTATFSALSPATSYSLVITAIDEGGQTSSEPLIVTTLYETPTALILTVASITSQSFVASWTGGSPATSYIYKLNGIPIAPSVDNGLTTKSATFASLTAAATYTLIVTSVNNNVQTSSEPLVITTLVAAPSVLSVSTSFITYQSFVASWTGGSGATSYIYALNGSAVTPSVQTSNSASFASLNAATSYTVTITAVNNGGQTVSAPLVVTTLSQPPTALTVSTSSITHQSFVASWTGGVRATSYSYTLNGATITPSAQTSNSANFTSLNGTTSYTLIVTAMNNGGQISSDSLTITTLATPPTTPIITTSSITSQSFIASWTGGDRATSYLYTLNGTSVTPIDNGLTNKAAIFSSLTPATSYTLIVTAVNGTAQISSSPVVVTTFTQAPTALILTTSDITYQSFVASWTGGSGATSYRYTLNGSAATPLTQTSNSASFTSLAASTSYTLVVTAVNNGGSTSSSPLVITTPAQQVFPLPIHQLVLSDTDDDTGSAYVDVVVTDPSNVIVYTNNGGKDCMHIVSDGTNPRLTMPCIFTETSSFTFGFWIKFDTINAWGVPITMNGANININVGFNASSSYISVGNGVATSYAQNNIMTGSDFLRWNHITLTYRNGSIKAYQNGAYSGSISFTQAFTISQITLGGNFIYQSIGLGGQAAWNGYLRQVCVFDSILNGNDILQLYAKTQDNTVIGVPLPKVTKLKETFNIATTVQSATSAINAALATNTSTTTVVTAALATASPAMFTALVTNPVFIGTTVSIPSSVASVLYAAFEDKSTLDTSLPFKINFPQADGIVTPPAVASNSKLAIDLTVDTYVAFKGCTGYGIHVVGGQQYFTTPSNPVGTLVHVGDILTFTIDAGATGSFKVADLDIVLIPYTPPTVICFLGSAPVLTPSGYSRIDSLAVGDLVCTNEGDTTAVIEKVEKQEYMPGRDTNPYIIPAGRFGSNGRILISPRHKVAVDGQMIEARHLGLEQEEQYEKIRYYNIQVTNCDNIIVAGLEVESLQLLTRVNIPMDTFNYIVTNKYDGKISDEIKAGCHLMADGTMSVPMIV